MATVIDNSVAEPDTSGRPARKAHPGWHSTGSVIALRILVIAAALVLWQLTSGPVVPEYAVSKPTDVYDALTTMLGSASGWTDIKVTTTEVLAGFGLGVAAGTVMGLVLGSFPLLGKVLEPLVAAVNGIPKIALAPLFLLFFGIGQWSKITIAMTGVAFVVFYNIYLGLRLRERELVEVVQVMGGRKHHVLGYVTIPTLAAPSSPRSRRAARWPSSASSAVSSSPPPRVWDTNCSPPPRTSTRPPSSPA